MKTKKEMISRGIMIATLCLTVSFNTIAQVTCSRERVGEIKLIASTAEYLSIQDSIQSLAYDLYLISESYPNYKYVHHTNDLGMITAVSVVGIADVEVANKAATNLIILEVLGEKVRTVDAAFLPQSRPAPGMLTKQEAAAHKPSPPRMKNKQDVIVSSF
ncbi:hypothetical protein [Pseudochryseolinea flava]|uniref:BON domain-containing protein n=1 Tax=Pseudochryseolinea flava TaxID=2059302 RepID=A0A364Y130_9BACT|nr:hypothetical protein [Pseudochryseolinea flava]RAW00318.1 hypothetical protein DQQ10_14795 [Pseudochryseolinea flava]